MNWARRSAFAAAVRMASTMKACGVTPGCLAAATASCFTSSGSFNDVVDIAGPFKLSVLPWLHLQTDRNNHAAPANLPRKGNVGHDLQLEQRVEHVLNLLRRVHNGLVPTYALSLFVGVVAVVLYFVFV